MPRISVDTLHDWERIKTSYTNAAMGELEARLSDTNEEGGTRTEEEKEVLRAHMRKVRVFVEGMLMRSEVEPGCSWQRSSLRGRSRCPKPTCASMVGISKT